MNKEQKPEALQPAEKLRDAITRIELGFLDAIATNDLSLAAMELESLHTRVQELEAKEAKSAAPVEEGELYCTGCGRIGQIDRVVGAPPAGVAPVVLPEPDSYLFQHEDTGQTMFVDAQQVEWGFEANNPRLHKVSGVYTEQQVRELLAQAPQPQAGALDAESWISESDSKPLESDGEVFVRFSDGTFGTGWASYWHDASNDYFVQWSHPDPNENRTVTHWIKPPTIYTAAPAKENK